jgi:hypothetical protein
MRWVLVGLIGIFTGIIAFLIDICVRYLFQLKFSLFDKGMEGVNVAIAITLYNFDSFAVYDSTINSGMIFLGFLALLALNIPFAVIASLLIFAKVKYYSNILIVVV